MPSRSTRERKTRALRVRRRAASGALLGALPFLVALAASPAEANPPSFVGVRALGMGSALRAGATGDAGPALNPSGMSLARTYVLEGAYQYLSQTSDNFFHGSIVDSLSNDIVAAGFSYTYQRAAMSAVGPYLRSHDFALSVATIAGARASFGGTLRYLRLRQDGGDPVEKDALTFDLGATLRPVDGFALAVVGTNLRNLSTPQAPVALSGGVAFTGVPDLVLDVDAILDFGRELPHRGHHVGVVAGGEYLLFHRFAMRLGGGRDPFLDHGFLSAGLGIVGEMGAIDAGWRQDLSGSLRQTYAGVSVRLFVPEPRATP